MGGYDCLLFKETEKLPTNPKDFWKEVKKRMFPQFGGSKREFNSLWYSEDTSFGLFWVGSDDIEDDNNLFDNNDRGLWGKLNW